MNFYKRHIGDYVRDTAHLSMIEDGAYTRMLDLYYANEKPLPSEKKVLYRLLRSRTKDEQAAVDSVLNEFFFQEQDGWHQRRADGEVSVAQAKAETNRLNGKAGGRPKKETDIKPTDNPKITDSVSESNPKITLASNQTPVTSNQVNSKSLSGKPEEKKATTLGLTDLLAVGVDRQAAQDWLIVRKAKHAPLTDTALNELKREAGKAGISVAQAVTICARKSWQGFKASWDWRDAAPASVERKVAMP